MNRHLRSILENPFVGKSLRKIFWIMLISLRRAERFVGKNFWRMPYVKLHSRQESLISDNKVYVYLHRLKAACTYLLYQPKISILIPLYKVQPQFLRETLLSIAFQVYENWEVCIVDDCSEMPELSKIVREFQTIFPAKIKFRESLLNLHISGASNQCLEIAQGDYCALLDHDDRLLPNSLAEMIRAINLHNHPDILYSDERTVNDEGYPVNDPFYKPSWSPFMHLAMNYTTHLTVYSTNLVRKVGGFRKGFEGSQDHDLMLRMTEVSQKPVIHVPLCLYQWRAHKDSTARSIDAKPYAAISGEKAVREACLRRGYPAEVSYEPRTGHYRVKFEIKHPLPKVSIIIPSKNCYELISTCLESIFSQSTYQNYEVVLVDNGSTDQRCYDLYKRYESNQAINFHVIQDTRPFNFAAQNYLGVEASSGEYLLFLNNDTKVLTADWIEELLRVAQFPNVGAVGCKLLYPNGEIQHAGILGAGRDIGLHAGLKLERNHNLYCQMLNTMHEVIAVTGACMMVARDKYLEANGFDDQYLQNGYGDMDLCLKLRKLGYSNLFNPYAVLTHYESISRGAGLEEFEKQLMIAKWGEILVSDPYLNPNLCYGEYYNINREKDLMDINWNTLDPRQLPLSDQAINLVHAWDYKMTVYLR